MRALATALLLAAIPGKAASMPGSPLSGLSHITAGERGIQEVCERAELTCGVIIDRKHSLNNSGSIVLTGPPQNAASLFDLLVKANPGYRWRRDRGVVLIEPTDRPRDVQKKVYGSPVNLPIQNLSTAKAAYSVLSTVKIGVGVRHMGAGDLFRNLNAYLSEKDLVSALNRLVELDGKSMWVLSYSTRAEKATYEFDVVTWRTSAEFYGERQRR